MAPTKTLAREWGPYGIRPNAPARGFVPTESAGAAILSDKDADQRMLSLIPLWLLGLPEEVAAVAE